jgi:hypothetical protein
MGKSYRWSTALPVPPRSSEQADEAREDAMRLLAVDRRDPLSHVIGVSGSSSTLQAIDSVKLGGGGYKRNGGSTPCASYHHRRKYVRAAHDRWAPQPRKSARHARETAKIARSGGITASKGARLAMVGFRLDAPCLCWAVLWSVRP